MIRLLARGLAARFRAGRAITLLSVLGVALGVASVLSIQLINRNAIGAFEGSVRAVSGDADLSILGRTPVVPESLLVPVLATPGVERADPVYRVSVIVEGDEPLLLQVLGLDLLAPNDLPWREEPEDPAPALTEPGWAAFSPALARERGWSLGDRVPVSIGSRRVDLRVGAFVEFRRRSPFAGTRLVVMDLAQVQGALGRRGELHQIDVRVRAGTEPAAVASRLRERLGERVQVLSPEQRRNQAARLLEAFRLNLTALSLVSLFVGAFLVFGSTQALLVRRRREIGVLRTLGATRGQVLGLLLGESALAGIAGVAIGIPAGVWLAEVNLGPVSATIANLYLLSEIESLRLEPATIALGAAIGIGASVLGAAWPSWESSRRDPRELLAAFPLHEGLETRAGRLFLAGLGLVAMTALAYATLAPFGRIGGFLLGLAVLVALPFVSPYAVRQAARRVRTRAFGLAYGFRSLALALPSTAMAVAALAVAVSMLFGVTLLIGSFRRTVEVWIGSTARADVYVTTESWNRARREAVLGPALFDSLASHPDVRAVDRLRQFHLDLDGRRISFAGFDAGVPGGEERFALLEGEAGVVTRRLAEEGAVAISEPLARKAGLGVGDRLPIPTPAGAVDLPIAGVYYDYTTEGGSAVVDLATLERHFGPGPVNNVALYLKAGRSAERVADDLRRRFADRPLRIRSNRDLRAEVLRIFDRTFAITRLLQALALVIAAGGITLTLLVMARERLAELALYRALGARRRQVARIFLGKGLGVALLGTALGALGGLALALLLIYVINRTYFGWTLALHWPWAALAGQTATIFAAALAASLYPALAASRTPASELAREDV